MTPESVLEPVDVLIERVMKRYPGVSPSAQLRYFEAVHQELAPLARNLELENRRLQQQLAEQKQTKFDLLESTRKKLEDANNQLGRVQDLIVRDSDCHHCSAIQSLFVRIPRMPS